MVKFSALFFFTILAAFVPYFGSAANGNIGIYELKNQNISVKLTNLGASIISLVLPDKNGKLADVVLGYDSIKDYKKDVYYFGAVIGRVANTIKDAQFKLNGTVYKLVANVWNSTIHGGLKGFSKVVWKVSSYQKGRVPHIIFTYHSFDGEQGFPGNLRVSVNYTLIGQKLIVALTAFALDKPTPVNLAQHTYWNLGGHNSGSILSNEIQIFGSKFAPLDRHLNPTGKIVSVKGTPFDFLKPQTIGSRINTLKNGYDGYDIHYVLDGAKGKELKPAAVVHDKKSGRVLEVSTTAPVLELYTSDQLRNVKGKGGYVYKPRSGLVLTTHGFPDAVNHPNFPSQIVTKGKPYENFVLYKFSTK